MAKRTHPPEPRIERREHEWAVEIARFTAGWGVRMIFPNLDLQLARGRTTALVGPAGSGKSVLLDLLERMTTTGLDVNLGFDGTPWWIGNVATSLTSCAHMAERGDDEAPLGELLEQFGVEAAALAAWLPELAAREAWLERTPSELPAALARLARFRMVSLAPAELLLFDEPTKALDDESARRVENVLLELRGARTCVVATHHHALVRAISDEVLTMMDGEIIEKSTVATFAESSHSWTREWLARG
ncbi:ATP-binding cassette domain-containing protein [Nannocystaceae bacterium ST9]